MLSQGWGWQHGLQMARFWQDAVIVTSIAAVALTALEALPRASADTAVGVCHSTNGIVCRVNSLQNMSAQRARVHTTTQHTCGLCPACLAPDPVPCSHA